MSVSHSTIALNSSTQVMVTIPESQEPAYSSGLSISIQNLDTSAYVYVGGSGVTSSNYGFRIYPNQSLSLDLAPADELYAISSGSSSIAVLRVYHTG